jgi:hypothetical protein
MRRRFNTRDTDTRRAKTTRDAMRPAGSEEADAEATSTAKVESPDSYKVVVTVRLMHEGFTWFDRYKQWVGLVVGATHINYKFEQNGNGCLQRW